MEQEKRVIVAFALSFAVLLLWRVFMTKNAPPRPKPVAGTSLPAQPATANPGAPTVGSKTETPAKPEAPGKTAPARTVAIPSLPVQQGTAAQDIVVESDLYKVTFSTQGALIKSWVLKKYRDANENPLELVNQPACDVLGYPMSVVAADPEQTLKANTDLNHKVNSAFFISKASELLSPAIANEKHLPDAQIAGPPYAAPIVLEFTFSDGTVLVHKKFSFDHGYEAHVEVSVSNSERNFPVGVEWPGGFGDDSLPIKIRDNSRQAVYGTADKITTVLQAKVADDQAIAGPLGLAGLEDRFFTNLFLPESPDQPFPPDVAFQFGRHAWNPPDWKEKEPPRPITATLLTKAEKPLAFRLFIAPKALDILGAQKPSLENLVSFGWFTIVAKPLFLGLHYINDNWTHNYGWAIVLLTILINFAMFPLKVKSIRSAQNMQKVAPLMKEIQDRYKQYKFNDPRKQRMNQEMTELYKKHGVNPLGGCLPTLLQLPFLYGFYRVLDQAIELRHAPWILWFRDLSAPDNFHLWGYPLPLLPVMMVITMFIQTKITPMATTDPGQQRMMMLMPLIFGVMFFSFPSGLVLYYLAANVVGIAQQLFINRTMPIQPITPEPQKPGKKKE